MTKKNTKVKPLHNNVLIEPVSNEKDGLKTKSGIFIPETVDKEKPDHGVVVAVGEGKRDEDGELIPMALKKGDKVMFISQYGLNEIKVDDKKYYIMSEDSVLAVIE